MSKEQYILGLDLGTANFHAVLARIEPEGFRVIACVKTASAGIRRGVVVDVEEAVSAISITMERIERITGVTLSSAILSVNDTSIVCQNSKGVIAVSKPDGDITEHDVLRVINDSKTVSMPPNRDLLHVLPNNFSIDGQGGIKDPVGMNGIRLEVETTLIHCASTFLKNMQKALMQSGLEVEDYVASGIASSGSVITKNQKDLGVVVIDMGAGTTTMTVYEEGNLLMTKTIPLGSGHITNDIAIGFRTKVDVAEKVKLHFAALGSKVVDNQRINLADFDQNESGHYTQRELEAIVQPRFEEIMEEVKKELIAIDKLGKLPAGVILTGGGSNLVGCADIVKQVLQLPVHMGLPIGIETIIDQIYDPEYSAAVGLLVFAQNNHLIGYGGGRSFGEITDRIKGFFKSILP